MFFLSVCGPKMLIKWVKVKKTSSEVTGECVLKEKR